MIKRWIKRWIIAAVDWFIRNYYSQDYIHRDMIREEIGRRITACEARLNYLRDRQEEDRLDALKIEQSIIEDGYIAEISRLEKIVDDVLKMRKDVEKLYFEVVRRAKDLAIITAENQHEGARIVKDVSASIGRIDSIALKNQDLVEEIEKNKRVDYERLRIR